MKHTGTMLVSLPCVAIRQSRFPSNHFERDGGVLNAAGCIVKHGDMTSGGLAWVAIRQSECVAMLGLQVMWNTVISVVPLTNKSTSQMQSAIGKQVKAYGKLLEAFCGSVKLESALLNHIQVSLPPAALAYIAIIAI